MLGFAPTCSAGSYFWGVCRVGSSTRLLQALGRLWKLSMNTELEDSSFSLKTCVWAGLQTAVCHTPRTVTSVLGSGSPCHGVTRSPRRYSLQFNPPWNPPWASWKSTSGQQRPDCVRCLDMPELGSSLDAGWGYQTKSHRANSLKSTWVCLKFNPPWREFAILASPARQVRQIWGA